MAGMMKEIKAGSKPANSVYLNKKFVSIEDITESLFLENKISLESIKFSGNHALTKKLFGKKQKEVHDIPIENNKTIKQIVTKKAQECFNKTISEDAHSFFKIKPYYLKTFKKYTLRINKLIIFSYNSGNIYNISNIKNTPVVAKMNGQCVSKLSKSKYIELRDDLFNIWTDQCHFRNINGGEHCPIKKS